MQTYLIEDDKPTKAPTFIRVLLVITFIVFGFQFLSLGGSWLAKEKLYNLEDQGADMTTLLNMVENTSFMVIHLLSILLVITGAILLWKMKKTGFFVYMTGKLIILIDVYLMGVSEFAVTSFLIGFVFWAIWPVVFAIHFKKFH